MGRFSAHCRDSMCSGASQASADPVEDVASHEGGGLDVLNAKHLCELEVLQKGCPPDMMSGNLEAQASSNLQNDVIILQIG